MTSSICAIIALRDEQHAESVLDLDALAVHSPKQLYLALRRARWHILHPNLLPGRRRALQPVDRESGFLTAVESIPDDQLNAALLCGEG